MKRYLILLLIPLMFVSCKRNLEKEMDELQAYLDKNNIDVDPTASGLYYIETKAGTGDSPEYGDPITVHYEGKLLNGDVFDTSYGGEPAEFTMGELIKGWNEGLSYMKEGGEATMIIPSTLAYGSYGSGELIPPYTTLLFKVELIEVYKQ